MAYLVNVTLRAERDLALVFDAINAERSDAAFKWYRGLKEGILSLEEQPNRCPETPENARLRNLLYGNKPHIYRVIYRVTRNRSRWTCFTSGTVPVRGSNAPRSSSPGRIQANIWLQPYRIREQGDVSFGCGGQQHQVRSLHPSVSSATPADARNLSAG